ncbi:MAG: septum formation initiator family protein, partial [Actinomycetota bacterium]|nr:septum formation initiator family protein [Actinomycetota bacterium]
PVRGRAGPVFAALALVGVLALAVFPAKAVLDQRHDRKALAARLADLSARNRALQERADQLQTDEEIERLARQYNLVRPGEEAYFVLPRPPAQAPTPAPETPPPPPAERSRSLWDRIAGWF